MALSWQAIAGCYEIDADRHWRAANLLGLSCPFDVFEQLFHGHHSDVDYRALYRHVDWSRVVWDAVELSGIKWRRVVMPRAYQYAVDEARVRTREEGLADHRPMVMTSWQEEGTWLRSPVMVEGDVLRNGFEYELLVGYTRLGDLLGLLDRGELAEWSSHRTWVGMLIRG
jgi:hypothetical protein